MFLIWKLLIFQCLLTEKEMGLRPEEWEESMVDSIKLFMDPEDEEEEGEGIHFYIIFDQSIASTKTKYIKLNIKTPNFFNNIQLLYTL